MPTITPPLTRETLAAAFRAATAAATAVAQADPTATDLRAIRRPPGTR